jgi:PAS domain S-box-containing protein
MPDSNFQPNKQTAILHAAILDHSGHSIVATDEAGLITVFNKAAQAMLGYTAQEVVGISTPSLFHLPSEVVARAEQFSQELGQALFPGFEVFVAKTLLGLPNEHEWTYVRKDGSQFPVLLSVTALQDEQGQPAGFLGMAVDITARKRSESLYRNLFHNNPNPMMLYDTQTVRILEINAAALQLYGYREAQLLGAPLDTLLPPNEHAHLRDAVTRVRASADEIRLARWQHRRKDGSLFWVDTVSKPQQAGDPLVRMVLVTELTDIVKVETEQRETMAALRDSESRMVQVLHGTPVPTFVIDAQHRVVHWNPACERILGFSAQEMMGKTDVWRVFYPGPRPVMANLIVDGSDTGALRDFYGETCARSYVNPDAFESVGFFAHMDQGAGRWLHFCASPLRDGQGQVVGAIETLMDITEQKKAEDRVRLLNEDLELRVHARTNELAQANEELRTAIDQLVQAEKLASLGRLVAGVAHELNTPIGIMVTVASTQQQVAQDLAQALAGGAMTRSALSQFVARSQEGAELLLGSAKRAAELIQNFKQVAVDQTTDQLRDFDLAHLLSDVLSVIAHVLTKTPVKLVQQLEPGIAMHSYPGPLGQVVTNLVMNALLHGFEANQTGTIEVSCRHNEDHVLVTVRDDGQGIPPAILDKIFDPFFTTKLGQGGTGLGLYISHNIVHGPLGGSLSVQSNPGMGTTFTLKFPCALGARCNPHCGLIHSHP